MNSHAVANLGALASVSGVPLYNSRLFCFQCGNGTVPNMLCTGHFKALIREIDRRNNELQPRDFDLTDTEDC